jgi:plastocyanin
MGKLLLIAATLVTPLAFAAAAGQSHSVSIKDMRFDPGNLTVKVGDTVTWTNNDDRDHTVVARDGSFNSDNIRPGRSYSYQFTKAGKCSYSCSYHPRMKGTVTVSEK